MPINLEKICHNVCELSKTTGAFILAERSKFSTTQIEIKGKNDFVSYVDKTSEKLIVEGLEKLLSEAGFIAEEGTFIGNLYSHIMQKPGLIFMNR